MQPPWYASRAYQFDMCRDMDQQGRNQDEGNINSSVRLSLQQDIMWQTASSKSRRQ